MVPSMALYGMARALDIQRTPPPTPHSTDFAQSDFLISESKIRLALVSRINGTNCVTTFLDGVSYLDERTGQPRNDVGIQARSSSSLGCRPFFQFSVYHILNCLCGRKLLPGVPPTVATACQLQPASDERTRSTP